MKSAAGTIMHTGYQVKYFAVTDVGCKRSHNEDDFLIDDKNFVFAVADGVGGLGGGEIASHLALAKFKRQFASSSRKMLKPSCAKRITRAIEYANTAVFSYGNQHNKRIATTLALLVLSQRQVHLANVGDSRIYVWRKDKLEQLTTDHTVRQEMVANGLMEQDDPTNREVDHVITRAVGAQSSVVADLTAWAIQQQDLYLICSDGITSMLSDEKIAKILHTMTSVEQAGSELIENAKAAGGRDNITLILLRFIPGS